MKQKITETVNIIDTDNQEGMSILTGENGKFYCFDDSPNVDLKTTGKYTFTYYKDDIENNISSKYINDIECVVFPDKRSIHFMI